MIEKLKVWLGIKSPSKTTVEIFNTNCIESINLKLIEWSDINDKSDQICRSGRGNIQEQQSAGQLVNQVSYKNITETK
jgi:hypothetical protein